jgi:hypothetical protein
MLGLSFVINAAKMPTNRLMRNAANGRVKSAILPKVFNFLPPLAKDVFRFAWSLRLSHRRDFL